MTRGFCEAEKEASWIICGADGLRSWLETGKPVERILFDELASEKKVCKG